MASKVDGSLSLSEIDGAVSREGTRLPRWRALMARSRALLTDKSDHSVTKRVAATAFAIRVFSAAIAYLSQVLLARWMGTYEFGIYAYVWTWMLLIGGIVDVGLATSAQRFIPEYAGGQRLDRLRGFIVGAQWLAVGIATSVGIIAAALVWVGRGLLHDHSILPLYLACIALPFFVLTRLYDGMARPYNWVHAGLLPPYIFRPLLLLGLMGASYVAGLGNDAVTATLLFVAATWVTAILQIVQINRRFARQIPSGPRVYEVRSWFAVSFPIFLVEIFYLLLTHTDVLILNQYRTPDEVAVYFAASKTLALVAFVYFAVAAAVAHRFTSLHVSGDREQLDRFLGEAIRWTFWPSLAATVLILVVGKSLLSLFGPQFTAGYSVIAILSVGLLARAAIGPVERLLNMLGEQRLCAVVYAVAFSSNLVACVVLVPRFGLEGAACATASAMIVETILLAWVTRRRLGFNVLAWALPSRGPRKGAEHPIVP